MYAKHKFECIRIDVLIRGECCVCVWLTVISWSSFFTSFFLCGCMAHGWYPISQTKLWRCCPSTSCWFISFAFVSESLTGNRLATHPPKPITIKDTPQTLWIRERKGAGSEKTRSKTKFHTNLDKMRSERMHKTNSPTTRNEPNDFRASM